MEVEFICGCRTKEIIARENTATMDMVTFDSEGFLSCVVHHERRRNWKTLPVIDSKRGKYFNYEFARLTPLEREALLVFNEVPQTRTLHLKFDGPDLRDNRDPASLAVKVGAVSAFGGNVILPANGQSLYAIPR